MCYGNPLLSEGKRAPQFSRSFWGPRLYPTQAPTWSCYSINVIELHLLVENEIMPKKRHVPSATDHNWSYGVSWWSGKASGQNVLEGRALWAMRELVHFPFLQMPLPMSLYTELLFTIQAQVKSQLLTEASPNHQTLPSEIVCALHFWKAVFIPTFIFKFSYHVFITC